MKNFTRWLSEVCTPTTKERWREIYLEEGWDERVLDEMWEGKPPHLDLAEFSERQVRKVARKGRQSVWYDKLLEATNSYDGLYADLKRRLDGGE